jgi:hypothetical protein
MNLRADPEALPSKTIESELAALFAHTYAATYRILCLIRTFDERGLWGDYGARSMAHWLNWRVGLDIGAAREKVRVAHALKELPKTAEKLSRGEISYSKVRALTRVATPEDEEAFLNVARHGTASHMERLVRGIRQAERAQDADFAMRMHEQRELIAYQADDGSLLVKARLTPEVGALFLEALEKALTIVREGQHGDEPQESFAAERADALAVMAESLLANEVKSGDRYQAVVHVSAETSEMAVEDGPVLPRQTGKRLLCDSAVIALMEDADGEPLSVGRKRRTVSTAIRRALQKRDGGCRFPGCGQTVFVDAHHIVHWVDGGETSLDNLLLLCRHHHRQLHEGGWRLEKTCDGSFAFFDRFGAPIPEAFTLWRAELDAFIERNQALDISAETYACKVNDHRWDAELAVWAFVNSPARREGLLSQPP